jgi:hypothetical protein
MPDPTPECGSCHAPVYWCVKSPEELQDKGPNRGKPKTAPVDVASVGAADGKLEVWSEPVIPVRDGGAAYVLRFRYLKRGEEPAEGHKRATSHFATCPDAGSWRRS